MSLPIVFASHGGGPWPCLSVPGFDENERLSLLEHMRSLSRLIEGQKPRAILIISAHWEMPSFTVMRAQKPGLLFDYYGFPDAAYQLSWPGYGSIEIADEILTILQEAKINAEHHEGRGFDHGVFIPMIPSFPEPPLPVIQLSLKQGLDPTEHITMGRALSQLPKQGVYVIGSGNSYHNLKLLRRNEPTTNTKAEDFDAWLKETITAPESVRNKGLIDWAKAPNAQECHPREEHLAPIFVLAGIAGQTRGRVLWEGTMLGKKLSAFIF